MKQTFTLRLLPCLICFVLFTPFMAQAITITSFSPASGPAGTLVTLNGVGLGNSATVNIGGVDAILISATGTTIVAMVMPGAVSGAVKATNASGTATAGGTFTITRSKYPNQQQGAPLYDNTTSGKGDQGLATAISSDGNTAAVCARADNSSGIANGSVAIYIRTGGVWVRQAKLVGKEGYNQATYVALSADGNTAVIAGHDNGFGGQGAYHGFGWIFKRTGSTWAQQAFFSNPSMLAILSVGISADGNTAVLGDRGLIWAGGGAWIYTRNQSGSWAQQGDKLVPNDATTTGSGFGYSVAISADGKTVMVGGYHESKDTGAAWIFTRNGNTWLQQGNKLVGTGINGKYAGQGFNVALSADGNTAISGGIEDEPAGAAWVFTRTGNTWAQQGSKLVGADYTLANGYIVGQGVAVSISADGNTALVGGYEDNRFRGAAWVYTRNNGLWAQRGNKLTIVPVSSNDGFGYAASLSGDGNTAAIGEFTSAGGAYIFAHNDALHDTTIQTVTVCAANLPYRWNGKNYSAEGSYTTTLVSTAGDDSTVTLVLHISINQMTANYIADTLLCYGGLSNLKIRAAKGKAPYMYSIDSGASYHTANTFKLRAGTYNTNVMDAIGCNVAFTVTIQQSATKLGLSTMLNVNCTTGNGTITANAEGSYGNYIYKLNTGAYQASNVFTVTPGTYTVTVKDSQACVLDKTVTIGALTGELKISRPELCYGETGQLHVAATNGTSPYQYSLDGTTFQASPNFTRHAGTYTATVMDAAGCTITTNSAALTQPAAPVTASYTVQNVSCSGGNDGGITVNASGGYSTSYTYRTANNAFTSSNVFTGLAAGTYKVSTRDARNCTIFKNIAVKPSSTPCFAATDATADALSKTGSTATDLKVTVFPNPGVTDFNLVIQGGDINKPVDVRVTDMLGKTIYQAHGTTGDTYRFGNRFAGGMYIAEITNGKNVQRVKLVKGQ